MGAMGSAWRRAVGGTACVVALGGGIALPASAEVPGNQVVGRAVIPGSPEAGSRPDAPVTIYLDFDGEVLEDGHWNRVAGSPRLDFVASEAATPQFIAEVWASVAEDYAPFDVNVTTTHPGDDRLHKTSPDDEEYGSHAIITDAEIVPEKTGTAGFAWIGGAGSEYYAGAIVVPMTIGGGDPARAGVKAVAEAVAHEVGHNFGLDHQGIDDGSGLQEYYSPSEGLWGPIMGAAALTPISQWTRGDYAGATQTQDDIATITDRSGRKYVSYDLVSADGESYFGAVCPIGDADLADPELDDRFQEPSAEGECDGSGAPLIPLFTFVDRADPAEDRIGDDLSSAAELELVDGAFSSRGVVERQEDVDVFRISAEDGELTARVAVAEPSPNLDAKLTLTDAAGTVIAESQDTTTRVSDAVAEGLGAEISAQVVAGAYYLTVDGVGSGDPGKAVDEEAHGFTDYGSVGHYLISGSLAASGTGGGEAPGGAESGDDGAGDGGLAATGGAASVVGAGFAAALLGIGILLVRSRRGSRAG